LFFTEISIARTLVSIARTISHSLAKTVFATMSWTGGERMIREEIEYVLQVTN
jgi:hypothetical protein